MKPIHATLTAMAGLLVLMNSPLLAQEPMRTPKTDVAPHSRRPTPSEGEQGQPKRDAEEKMTPFIGVLTSEVPRELRSHFDLPEGFGLMVQEVMPDTPAQAAGIEMDDILVNYGDQKLVNMEQLQTLVRSQKKDDEVNLTIISGGQKKEVTVKIAVRMMPVRDDSFRGGNRYFQPFGTPLYGEGRGSADMMKEMRESLEMYQKQMREYQERMRDWSRDGNKGDMPPAPSWSGPGRRDSDRRDNSGSRDGERGQKNSREGPHRYEQREFRETANVTRSDDSGIYSLRRDGDRMVFTAKPKDGEEKSWNLNDEVERNSIPADMKEKLKQLEEIRGSDRPGAGRGSSGSSEGEKGR